MRLELETKDIEAIAQRVTEHLRPLLSVTGKADRYMTTKELAKYLGLAYSTIANNKKYLPHTYLNGTPLFKQSEIDAYLEQFKVRPVSKKNTKFAELFNKR